MVPSYVLSSITLSLASFHPDRIILNSIRYALAAPEEKKPLSIH